ncbi:MAG TPA: hypothetical protein VIK03_04950 [Thermoleophilia bacterium]
MKLMRNTTAVLVLTLFTGLAVFTAIQLGGRLFGTPTASAQTVTTQAAQGQSGSSTGQSSSGSSQSDPNGYGSSSGSGSSSGGQTYTCPATGCTASTCHATQ